MKKLSSDPCILAKTKTTIIIRWETKMKAASSEHVVNTNPEDESVYLPRLYNLVTFTTHGLEFKKADKRHTLPMAKMLAKKAESIKIRPERHLMARTRIKLKSMMKAKERPIQDRDKTKL